MRYPAQVMEKIKKDKKLFKKYQAEEKARETKAAKPATGNGDKGSK